MALASLAGASPLAKASATDRHWRARWTRRHARPCYSTSDRRRRTRCLRRRTDGALCALRAMATALLHMQHLHGCCRQAQSWGGVACPATPRPDWGAASPESEEHCPRSVAWQVGPRSRRRLAGRLGPSSSAAVTGSAHCSWAPLQPEPTRPRRHRMPASSGQQQQTTTTTSAAQQWSAWPPRLVV